MTRKSDRTAMDGGPAKPAAAMSTGQAAYEARRAAEAGMSTEAWLKKKARDARPAPPVAPRKPAARKGLIGRLLDKAHKPL